MSAYPDTGPTQLQDAARKLLKLGDKQYSEIVTHSVKAQENSKESYGEAMLVFTLQGRDTGDSAYAQMNALLQNAGFPKELLKKDSSFNQQVFDGPKTSSYKIALKPVEALAGMTWETANPGIRTSREGILR